ncbi:MAG: hypothetical protein HOM34_07210 [Planctomycetes bacterium]|nr:hypothetical protein [Planctomycetota bacterium]MBT4028613.1 hypothetical protein [Planctomycetota bacterium]MBT4559505.1 hypothetical protein [Planctomycetota bacterium]MBT5101532.1 hypothetical protein [Planctomycetota bacterium]MBT5120491.1 hypothetical protein [Planctomycetota bacterium]
MLPLQIADSTVLKVDLDWVVLGFVCQFLAGAFLLSSMGRGRPRMRLASILGGAGLTLETLRNALHAKARGQAAALFFLLGNGLVLIGLLMPGPRNMRIEMIGVGALLFLALLFLLLLGRYVDNAMRRYIKVHLSLYPFSFEDNIQMTREIGALFGVESSGQDTLESFVSKVRDATGLPSTSRFGGGLK